MPQIIAALFDDRGTARRALQALMESGLTADRIAVIGDTEGRNVPFQSGTGEISARDDGQAALHDLPLPDEDLALFERGLAQGHVLVSARVGGDEFDRALGILEMFEPLDLDRRSEAWMRDAGDRAGADIGGPLAAGLTAGLGSGQTNTASLPGAGTLTDATDDLGSADLRTEEGGMSGTGASNTIPTGGRRSEERAEQPGVLEMDQRPDAALASKMAPALGAESTGRGNAQPDLYRRETNRSGRVRAYSSDV